MSTANITYLPVLQGHYYLIAIMDWYSRKVLSWRVSNTLEVEFCVEALEAALLDYGKPEIFNSDQGSQLTTKAFTGCLKAAEVKISMDGRERYVDNIFIERLWRARRNQLRCALKYELIYLMAFENEKHLHQEVKKCFDWYNKERSHQSLDYKMPNEVYRHSKLMLKEY